MTFDEALNPYVRLSRDHDRVVLSFGDIKEHFLTAKKAIVDLGCGNGHFLQEFLSNHTTWRGLGVERRFKRSFKTAQKLQSLSAWVLQNQVEVFLKESPDALWDEVWLQFPDPWPKARHEKNRMLTDEFIHQVSRVLKPGGRFCFRSDCQLYWLYLQRTMAIPRYFQTSLFSSTDLFSDGPATLYQKKFFSRSIPIYSAELKKLK